MCNVGCFVRQVWSILVGLPLCAVGGVLYSWASGKSVIEGIINAYGALYKIPGGRPRFCSFPLFSCLRCALYKCPACLPNMAAASRNDLFVSQEACKECLLYKGLCPEPTRHFCVNWLGSSVVRWE